LSDFEYFQPAGVATPPEPYSHVIRAGRLVFLAGQVAFDEEGRLVGAGDPLRQAEQCWKNIEGCLRSAGAELAHVVKVTCFLVDIRHVPYEIEVRRRLFSEPRWPAYTMVQVANLGREDLLFEIDVTAVLPNDRVARTYPASMLAESEPATQFEADWR
jgi:enamine deaminase RidA (YjgF/YER057c/UK114 family)